MIYAFVAQRCADMPVDAACRAMRVSKSAYYAWRQAEVNPTPRMLADREFDDLIVKIHERSYGTYGWRRVTAELRLGLGREVNHKRVARMMRERGLHGVTRRRRSGCTRSRATDVRSDDLVHRQFRPDSPDRLWVQDVTQHRSGEGWVYLAVVSPSIRDGRVQDARAVPQLAAPACRTSTSSTPPGPRNPTSTWRSRPSPRALPGRELRPRRQGRARAQPLVLRRAGALRARDPPRARDARRPHRGTAGRGG